MPRRTDWCLVFVILMFLFIVLTVLWLLLSLIFFWDFEWKENSCPKLAMRCPHGGRKEDFTWVCTPSYGMNQPNSWHLYYLMPDVVIPADLIYCGLLEPMN